MDYQKPEYSMTFEEDGKGQVANTDLSELTKKVLHSMNPAPTIDSLPDTFVKLPAGLIVNDKLYQDAEVQELTGEHEEKLAKARASTNPAKFVNTLLLAGTVSVGQTPATSDLLDSLLQGDLDMLLIGIRRATFGDEFELFSVVCPECGEENDLTMDLKDIPVRKLEDPETREFLVDLRKGRKARIQFPTGTVQNEIYKKELTVPEMNSVALSHCIISFINTDGSEVMCNGLADVKKLGLSDRKTLQNYIFDNQPGPRYDEVVATCHACEGEVPVPLNVGMLFREL